MKSWTFLFTLLGNLYLFSYVPTWCKCSPDEEWDFKQTEIWALIHRARSIWAFSAVHTFFLETAIEKKTLQRSGEVGCPTSGTHPGTDQPPASSPRCRSRSNPLLCLYTPVWDYIDVSVPHTHRCLLKKQKENRDKIKGLFSSRQKHVVLYNTVVLLMVVRWHCYSNS